MKICGIISEFNPFHNGHARIIAEAKKKFDYVICLMSGNFTQRGIPAVMSKFDRAECAILSQADMVVELPFVYACNGADEFAYGAIKTLKDLGCTDIMFGSESGNIEQIEKLANYKLHETKEFKNQLFTKLKTGCNYNQAYVNALRSVGAPDDVISSSLLPNDILASSYLKEIKKQKAPFTPHAILRSDNGYNSKQEKEEFLSASSIIERFKLGKGVSDFVPSATLDKLNQASQVNSDILFSLVKYSILQLTKNKLSKLLGVTEGIENKLYSIIHSALSYEDLANKLLNKRYRETRIRKLLLYILLGVTKKAYKQIKKGKTAVKVLSVSHKSKRELLKTLSKNKAKLILSNKDYKQVKGSAKTSLMLDLKASSLYSLITKTQTNIDQQIKLKSI